MNNINGGVIMIKMVVLQNFTLGRFDELKNLTRAKVSKKGVLYVGDTFECEKELADYLLEPDANGRVLVKVIEVTPAKPKRGGRKSTKKELTNEEQNDINK